MARGLRFRFMALRDEVRVWTVRYRAHNGLARPAYVALPADLGPRHNPALPLVISPHGRGLTGLRICASGATCQRVGGSR